MGIEPTRPCGQRILSPQRLPIPPLEHAFSNLIRSSLNIKAILGFFYILSIFSPEILQARDISDSKYASIPTPHRTFWAPKSLQVSAGVGNALQAGCNNFLFRWRGTGMFMYHPWLSGGVEVHEGGGLVSEDTIVASSRYKMFTRLHFSNNENYINYLAPSIGFDKGTITSLKAERLGEGVIGETSDASFGDACLEPGRNNGYDVGVEYGLGWRFKPYWTFLFSVALSAWSDQDFQNESTIGVAYDLARSWAFFKRDSNEFYLYGDSIWAFRKDQWEIIWMLGLGLGF